MPRLAFIPARGGSKRLPRKNIIEFAGRPMIVHTIDAARLSGLFDAIAVSTEDKEIAAIARDAGAEVLARPRELAIDTATVNQTLGYTLESLEAEGRAFDQICCLYATAPLRGAADILAAHALLQPPAVNFVIAVCRYPYSPYQALVPEGDRGLRLMWPELGTRQSHTLPRPVVDNGSTYWADRAAYRACGTFYGPGLAGYEMPLSRSVDIDLQEDLEIALAFARRCEAKERRDVA